MTKTENRLIESGLSKKDVAVKKLFEVSWFRDQVNRTCLGPSRLYWRVRAVFEVFGVLFDPNTDQPLFNKAAWEKANNILNEILCGYYSDPPGFQFYFFRTNPDGSIKKDRLGIPLLGCNRGTGGVKSGHKQFCPIISLWTAGAEMSDYLLMEHYIRDTIGASERHRPGFPKIGHYDTWLTDMVQMRVEQNHNSLVFPGHTNGSDYVDTPEDMGTVPLHDTKLGKAICALELPENLKLTADQRYLVRKCGTPLPPLPFHGKDELQKFAKMALSSKVPFNIDSITFEWLKHVNGSTIFPKLPVHFRVKLRQFTRNRQIRDAVKSISPAQRKLRSLNEITAMPSATQNESETQLFGPLASDDIPVPVVNENPIPVPTMALAPTPRVAAGQRIDPTPAAQVRTSKNVRSTDKKKRKAWRCVQCVQYNGPCPTECAGAKTGRHGGQK